MPAALPILAMTLGLAAPEQPPEDPRAPSPQWRDEAPQADVEPVEQDREQPEPQWRIVATDEVGSGDGGEDGIANRAEHADDDSEDDEEVRNGARGKDGKQTKKKSKLKVELSTRVMAGVEGESLRPNADQSSSQAGTQWRFFLRQARLKFRTRFNEHARVTISADLADVVLLSSASGEPIPFLRSAFGNIRVHDAFQIRVGRYKRPFSRLELRSVERIPFRSRGLFNSRFVGTDLRPQSDASGVQNNWWGDRGFGAMLWGKIGAAKLRWQASVTDAEPIPGGNGVDAIGRLVWAPRRWVSVGANGGYKYAEDGSGTKVNLAAGGGDARFRTHGFYFAAEANVAQARLRDGAWGLGVTGYANYDISLPKRFVLQPLLLGEFFDDDLDILDSESVRIVVGLNLLWAGILRVMPQVDIVRAFDRNDGDGYSNPFIDGETYYLMLTFQMP